MFKLYFISFMSLILIISCSPKGRKKQIAPIPQSEAEEKKSEEAATEPSLEIQNDQETINPDFTQPTLGEKNPELENIKTKDDVKVVTDSDSEIKISNKVVEFLCSTDNCKDLKLSIIEVIEKNSLSCLFTNDEFSSDNLDKIDVIQIDQKFRNPEILDGKVFVTLPSKSNPEEIKRFLEESMVITKEDLMLDKDTQDLIGQIQTYGIDVNRRVSAVDQIKFKKALEVVLKTLKSLKHERDFTTIYVSNEKLGSDWISGELYLTVNAFDLVQIENHIKAQPRKSGLIAEDKIENKDKMESQIEKLSAEIKSQVNVIQSSDITEEQYAKSLVELNEALSKIKVDQSLLQQIKIGLKKDEIVKHDELRNQDYIQIGIHQLFPNIMDSILDTLVKLDKSELSDKLKRKKYKKTLEEQGL